MNNYDNFNNGGFVNIFRPAGFYDGKIFTDFQPNGICGDALGYIIELAHVREETLIIEDQISQLKNNIKGILPNLPKVDFYKYEGNTRQCYMKSTDQFLAKTKELINILAELNVQLNVVKRRKRKIRKIEKVRGERR